MTLTTIAVAIGIAIGLAGIVVPVLPGSVLVLGAILVWALDVGSDTAWVFFGIATTFLVVGTVVKYAVPGRRLKDRGIPTRTLLLGTVVGIVGFFVVPVIGLFFGFVLGVYLAELLRVGRQEAWPATVHALKAVGLSMAIELAAACLAAATWAIGLTLT